MKSPLLRRAPRPFLAWLHRARAAACQYGAMRTDALGCSSRWKSCCQHQHSIHKKSITRSVLNSLWTRMSAITMLHNGFFLIGISSLFVSVCWICQHIMLENPVKTPSAESLSEQQLARRAAADRKQMMSARERKRRHWTRLDAKGLRYLPTCRMLYP